MADPFNLSLAQIAELTDRQIYDLYFHPRDEHGRIKVRHEVPARETLSPDEERAILFGMGSSLGIPLEQLNGLWNAKRGAGDGGSGRGP